MGLKIYVITIVAQVLFANSAYSIDSEKNNYIWDLSDEIEFYSNIADSRIIRSDLNYAKHQKSYKNFIEGVRSRKFSRALVYYEISVNDGNYFFYFFSETKKNVCFSMVIGEDGERIDNDIPCISFDSLKFDSNRIFGHIGRDNNIYGAVFFGEHQQRTLAVNLDLPFFGNTNSSIVDRINFLINEDK